MFFCCTMMFSSSNCDSGVFSTKASGWADECRECSSLLKSGPTRLSVPTLQWHCADYCTPCEATGAAKKCFQRPAETRRNPPKPPTKPTHGSNRSYTAALSTRQSIGRFERSITHSTCERGSGASGGRRPGEEGVGSSRVHLRFNRASSLRGLLAGWKGNHSGFSPGGNGSPDNDGGKSRSS